MNLSKGIVRQSNAPTINDDGSANTKVKPHIEPPLVLYFQQAIGIPTALTTGISTAGVDTDIEVDSVANISVGNYLGMFCSISNRFYFGEVLAVVDNTVSLDTPVDYEYKAGDTVISTTRELNVNGSSTTQIYSIQAGGGASTLTVNITRILFSMVTDSAVDLTLFGDLPALTKGIVLRRNNGYINNIFNIKTNLDLTNIAYDFDDFTATNPAQGVDGLKTRYSWNGQDKADTVVRLDPGDRLELLIQDNLSALTTFRLIAEGRPDSSGD